MQQLQQVLSVNEALDVFLPLLRPIERVERVPLRTAGGRVLAEPVVSRESIPGFARSTMDGFAVRSRDTAGASETFPALLDLHPETPIGRAADKPLPVGGAAPIATGAALPPGADAVVMVEYCERFDERTVAAYAAVAQGENVVQPGEDIASETTLFAAGKMLHPGDLGVLAALGSTEVTVYARPRVAVFASGNELVAIDRQPGPGQVRDINSYTLAGHVLRLGGLPELLGILPDDETTILRSLAGALPHVDLLVISGGSSLGTADLTERVFSALGEPGILVHGLAVKPGKPTLLALAGAVPCIGFPGHPLSALMTGELLLPPVLSLLGRRPLPKRKTVTARLSRSISSPVGRKEFVQVRLGDNGEELSAFPLQSKSAIISTVASADGYVILEQGSEGKRAGEPVLVYLWGEEHG